MLHSGVQLYIIKPICTKKSNRSDVSLKTLSCISTHAHARAGVCQRKTKDRADGMREKMPIALDGIRTCISGIRAHSASDCTTTAGTPPVSRNKHFRHSPVSSIVKQSCMKQSNSYLRDRDAKHLQGPPLSRTRTSAC